MIGRTSLVLTETENIELQVKLMIIHFALVFWTSASKTSRPNLYNVRLVFETKCWENEKTEFPVFSYQKLQ